jgi:hypothetical protein
MLILGMYRKAGKGLRCILPPRGRLPAGRWCVAAWCTVLLAQGQVLNIWGLITLHASLADRDPGCHMGAHGATSGRPASKGHDDAASRHSVRCSRCVRMKVSCVNRMLNCPTSCLEDLVGLSDSVPLALGWGRGSTRRLQRANSSPANPRTPPKNDILPPSCT